MITKVEKIKGEIRIRKLSDAFTAEQWTGDHWTLLHVGHTQKDINYWLDHEWERHFIDRGTTD